MKQPMFRIAICDDEPHFLEHERELIAGYMRDQGYSCQIDTFGSGLDVMAEEHGISQYDIIFLDINMDGPNGIETAKHIRKYSTDLYIVFVTGCINYSLEGYKVGAIRYILKDMETLKTAIGECLDTIADQMGYIEYQHTFDFLEGKRTISIDDILYIESNLHKLEFHLADKGSTGYTMYEKLDCIDEQLCGCHFCRIHKSFLVNLKYVEKIERYYANLYNGSRVSISQSKYKSVRDEFVGYRGRI